MRGWHASRLGAGSAARLQLGLISNDSSRAAARDGSTLGWSQLLAESQQHYTRDLVSCIISATFHLFFQRLPKQHATFLFLHNLQHGGCFSIPPDFFHFLHSPNFDSLFIVAGIT